MKVIYKRVFIGTAIVLAALALQWISGTPFERGITQAYVALCTGVIALWVAMFPDPDA